MIRVLIADDHAVVRQGLRTFLDLQPAWRWSARPPRRGGAGRCRRPAADIVLLDLVMPGVDGMEAMRRLRERVPPRR